MRAYLVERFRAIPDSLLANLTAVDGMQPTHPSIAVLAECAGLDEVELRILDFVEKKDSVTHFRAFLRETGCDAARDHLACLAAALDLRPAELQMRLYRHRSLGTLDLVTKAGRRSDLEDFIQAGELLEDIALPVRCPTMPCFGGADLRTLFITTARDKRPADELAQEPWAGAVLTLRVEVPGLPAHRCRL